MALGIVLASSGLNLTIFFLSDESQIEKKIAVIHFSSARGVHAALLMNRDPNDYDLTFSVSKQIRTSISPNKPTSVPTLKLPAGKHKRRLVSITSYILLNM